ncbi:MAG: ABC transporter permease [Calditrichaeota bacterium]|nr:MAG: ABC transporter permease [Calditrichota bacterium]
MAKQGRLKSFSIKFRPVCKYRLFHYIVKRMRYYLLRRFFISLFLIWSILTTAFLVLHLSPGDPVNKYISPSVPPDTVQLIRQNFGFDQPLHVQYLKWLKQWCKGDWGYSYSQFRPVSAVLYEALPNTLELTVPSLLAIFLLGTAIGGISAFRHQKFADRMLMNTCVALYCTPVFWLALMLIYIFSLQLNWFPSAHATSLFADEMSGWAQFRDRLSHIALPIITIVLTGTASIARYVRENVIAVLKSDFIKLAFAKGFSPLQVFLRYLLRHTQLPLISVFGLSFPFLLGGVLIVEIIFAWPGMGRLSLEAVMERDYPLVLATTGISAFMVVIGNFIADFLYVLADPRIGRHDDKKNLA